MPSEPTGKWPRIQFVFHCKTCDEKEIWNHKDGNQLAAWVEYEGHETILTHEFFAGRISQVQSW